MRARRHILRIALATAFAVALILPAQAPAEYYVPPGNSAATQYTESFPGAGGESGGKHKKVTPAETLGAGNAKSLQHHGTAGKEAAEVAAETAPAQLADKASSGSAAGGSEHVANGGGSTGGNGSSQGAGSGEGGSGSQTTSGSSGHPSASGGSGSGATKASQPSGSSALGQIAGQATGAGGGNVGLWLPLAIVLTLVGSLAYRARMRHGSPA